MKFTSPGLSMLEICDFFEKEIASDWWYTEKFSDITTQPAVYNFIIQKNPSAKFISLKDARIPEGYSIPSVALLSECILGHYRETGIRLLPNWYARTSSFDDQGGRVFVGCFNETGLHVLDDASIDYKKEKFGVVYIKLINN